MMVDPLVERTVYAEVFVQAAAAKIVTRMPFKHYAVRGAREWSAFCVPTGLNHSPEFATTPKLGSVMFQNP